MTTDKKKYPAKNSGSCIVCEDMRVELSGKYVLVGVYPGSSVQFHDDISDDHPGLISLMFVFWFGNCQGTFDTSLSVVDPAGQTVFERELGERVVRPGEILSFAAGVRNAQFKSTGKHRIVLSFDDREFEFPLIVGTNPVTMQAARK